MKFLTTIILTVLMMIGFSSCNKTENSPGGETGIQVGQIAPDFTLPDPDGNQKSLSDYQDKLVLIQFWASWCHFCRDENPELVSLYGQYKDKGFEIVGVSLDTDKSGWLNAIADDGIEFDQLSDLMGFDSPLAADYGVSSIPRMVLTDQDGKILLITNKASEVSAAVNEKLN